MRKLKKVVAITVVSAIMAASVDMSCVMAAENTSGEVVVDEATESENGESDFVVEDGVLVKYQGDGGDVVIPDSVTSIGGEAFSWCLNLISIEIPASVTSIGYSAFQGCSNLISIEIPSSVTSIGTGAFYCCSSLTSMEIPNSVTSIGSGAFERCNSLSSVKIPSSVTEIEGVPFLACENLKKIEVEEDNENYLSIDGVMYSKNGKELINFPSGKDSVEISSSVTSIRERAFCECDNLSSVEIPNGVNRIEYETFWDCDNLSSVKIPNSVTSIGLYAFEECDNLSSIEIPTSVTEIRGYAFECTKWLENKRKENPLVIVNGILIDGKTCSGDIEIPFGVTSIGDFAFVEAEVRNIQISSSVTSIGNNIFGKKNRNAIISCTKGSYAETYAIENNISYTYVESDLSEITPSEPSVEPNKTSNLTPTPTQTIVQTQQKAQTITAKNITKTYGTKAFNLGAKINGNGTLTYKSANTKVATVSNTGKVTIKGCGKTTITIKAAETNEYKAAEKQITITVKPKKQKVASLKSIKAKTITVKWKKDTKATGYIIQYSTDKKFKKNVKKVTISKNKTTTKKISKLKSGKKYYVRICSYKKASGAKIQGSYSAVKSVTVK